MADFSHSKNNGSKMRISYKVLCSKIMDLLLNVYISKKTETEIKKIKIIGIETFPILVCLMPGDPRYIQRRCCPKSLP